MGNKNGLGAVECDRGQTTIRITPGSIDCKFEDNYARRPLFTYRGNPCSFEVHTPWDQLRPKLVKGLRPCDKPTIATINEALSEAEVARFNDDLAAAGTQRARDQVAEHWQRQALEQRLLKILGPDLCTKLLVGDTSIIFLGLRDPSVKVRVLRGSVRLVSGFRRWLAVSCCTKLGISIPVPRVRGGTRLVLERGDPKDNQLLCVRMLGASATELAHDPNAHEVSAQRENAAENAKLDQSVVDKAHQLGRLIAAAPRGRGLTLDEVISGNFFPSPKNSERSMSACQLKVWLRLLQQPEDVQMKVHRGVWTLNRAMRKPSERSTNRSPKTATVRKIVADESDVRFAEDCTYTGPQLRAVVAAMKLGTRLPELPDAFGDLLPT